MAKRRTKKGSKFGFILLVLLIIELFGRLSGGNKSSVRSSNTSTPISAYSVSVVESQSSAEATSTVKPTNTPSQTGMRSSNSATVNKFAHDQTNTPVPIELNVEDIL